MLIRILGTVEVAANNSWVKAGSPKQNCVLAALALSPNRTLSIDAIANRVWGVTPPASARGVVYGHVNRLRELLKPHSEVTLTRVTGGGYRLDIHTEHVDALHMRTMIDRARGSASPDEASRRWREIVDLWRGPALSGVSGDWADRTRASLERHRSTAYTGYFDAELAAGRHHHIIGDIEEQLSLKPDDEGLAATLMLALYRDGQSAEALNRFAVVRERFRRNLGGEPSPALRQLHRDILRGEVTPAPPITGGSSADEPITAPDTESGPATRAPASPSAITPRQLPAATPSFTGRQSELAILVDTLDSGRDHTVVAIDGMAGIGKSTLAIQAANLVAQRYSDGQIFVDMHGHSAVTDPVGVHEARYRVMRSVGLSVEDIPATVERRADAYRSALTGKRLLLFIDNAADDSQVAPLLSGLDSGAVVVTSRQRLTIDDVTSVSLRPLTPDQARELLRSACGPGRFTTADEAALTEIAHWCDGLPLALRIAAARLRTRPQWSALDLLNRLRDDSQEMDTLAVGQRSVAAALALSIQQLTSRRRQLLVGLAWFPGPDLTLSAASAALSERASTVEAILEELVDVNLLDSVQPGRYRMHDLVRRHVRRETATAPDGFVDRIGAWYLHNTATARDAYIPQPKGFAMPSRPETVTDIGLTDDLTARQWFITEGANIAAVIAAVAGDRPSRTVWQLAAVTLCHTIVNGDRGTTDRLGRWGLTAALDIEDLAGQAVLRRNLGYRAMLDDNWATALEHFEPGLRLARQTGNLAVESMILSWLAHLNYRRGHLRQAVGYASEECAVNRRISEGQELDAINNLAVITTDLGDLTEAKRLLREALPRFERLDHPGIGTALGNLATVSAELGELAAASRYEDEAQPHQVGDADRAASLLRRSQVHRWRGERDTALALAVRALRLVTDSAVTGLHPTALAHAAAVCDDPDAAARYARESIEAAEQLSDVAGVALGRLRLAEVLLAIGDPAEATPEFERADSVARMSGREPLGARVAIGLARLRLTIDPVAAESTARGALAVFRRCGHRPWQVAAHLLLAEIHDGAGDPESLARELAAAETLSEAMGSTSVVESVRRRLAPVSAA